MSKMHEVTTAIRGPNTELPHPHRLSNGFQSTQSIVVDEANDKNNNQQTSNKNVLKKTQVFSPQSQPESNQTSNRIDKDNDNRRDNSADQTIDDVATKSTSAVKSLRNDVLKSLPKANRSTLSVFRDKGQPIAHKDGATVRATIIAVNDSKTNCNTETTLSRTSNECHNGKSSFYRIFSFLI